MNLYLIEANDGDAMYVEAKDVSAAMRIWQKSYGRWHGEPYCINWVCDCDRILREKKSE